MAAYDQGINLPYDSVNAGVIIPEVYGVGINFFINRTPLATRLAMSSVGSMSFKLTNDNYRPRKVTSWTSLADGTGTTLTVADSSNFDVGDVLQIESEYLEVTAIATSTTLTVIRGIAGTTGAAHTNTNPIYLITNSRTGGEVDVSALSRIPVLTTQYLQTIQHAYQVSGALQSSTNYISAYGSPIQRDKFMCIQHCFDDLESAMVYGKSAGLSGSVTRQKMAGFASLVQTNNTASPTNASAYKPSDLIRDTIQACRSNGGEPDVLFVSEDFLSGLSTWGTNVQRLNAGSTDFGTPINTFWVPFIPSVKVVEAPLLRPGTALCFNTNEVRIREKRPFMDMPRGRRGDAYEGDMIGEYAIEIDNEAHHAYVTGITAFSV